MPDRLFAPNPFSNDDGRITPELAAAYADPEHLRTESIVNALGRVLMPVLPHAHPGRDEDGHIGDHVSRDNKQDPLACPDDELVTVDFPGGRKAFPIFSSVDALVAWNAQARPVPIDITRVASAALQRGDGVLTLDEGSTNVTWLGRSAVAALATDTDWTGPWDDPAIVERITHGFDGYLPGLEKIGIQPGPNGTAVVVLFLIPPADRENVMNIAQTVSAVMATDEYVKARLDVVEIRPFYAGA